MAVHGLAGRADVVTRAFDHNGHRVVVLHGPLDRFTEDAVREALAPGRGLPLVVDLSDVGRLGIDVVAVFLGARARVGLVLAGPFARGVVRTLETSGTEDFFVKYGTLRDALRAVDA
ncbi:STAS domain-containing protein [Streptomyces sp. NBC_01497]|uniref:STAS domain-containing protein n=1 Tax=Streptomyces sp. NBC_01497 TaxID=2903885 RepID=UPI002E31AA22|nr:STAS domain-containing protein [Streptomyces sp. NBC_01497]